MKRNIEKLKNEKFDLIIIGGGIYGACAAFDASVRGLKVAVVEKDDFGGATSANSLKTVHGSLRYLQNLDFKRMFGSLKERNILIDLAPHLVKPLEVYLPVYGHGLKGKEALQIGLKINNILTKRHEKQNNPRYHFPPGTFVSKKETLDLFPTLPQERLEGSAKWYDAQMHNTERLTLSFLKTAVAYGAVIANYMEVVEFLKNKEKVVGVGVVDRLSGSSVAISGKIVLNTAGPWVGNVLDTGKIQHGKQYTYYKTFNLIMRGQLFPKAIGVLPRKKEKEWYGTLFIVPWRKHTMIGTAFFPQKGKPGEPKVKKEELDEFLGYINELFPKANLKEEKITYVHKGFVRANGHPEKEKMRQLKKYAIEDHENNVFTVVGVKYTTARGVAEKTIDKVMTRLGRFVKGSTSTTPLADVLFTNFSKFMKEQKKKMSFDEDVKEHLLTNYGSSYVEVLKLLQEEPFWKERVYKDYPVIKAEIVYAVREEMAFTLKDVLLRRTDLGTVEYPGDECVKNVAELMGGLLYWTPQKIKSEILQFKEHYRWCT